VKKFVTVALGLVFSTSLCFAYTDTETYSFGKGIQSLTEEGIIQGYSDGSFRPDAAITRAEFIKMVMTGAGVQSVGADCFNDVAQEWYAASICMAKDDGIVSGYEDGTFLPDQGVTLIEALKILVNVFEVKSIQPQGGEWYSASLETAAALNYIPSTLDYYAETLTRGEAAELLWRIMNDQRDEEATTLDEFKGTLCVDFEPETYTGVDMERVRETWLSWTNQARVSGGLAPYVYNEQLDRTAYTWSVASREKGFMDHKRPGTSAYYDYYAIQAWFEDLGLSFENWGGVTFTENIGHGPYSCHDTECTDELINAIEYTFDYYMSEAGSSYRPHYNSIMNSSFQEIGFGIVLTDSEYYFTVHYATKISSEPTPFCD